MFPFQKFQLVSRLLFALLLSLSIFIAPQGLQAGSETMGRIGDFPIQEYWPQGEIFELKNRQIENQHSSEECYLFAFTNYLQVANGNVFGMNPSPRLSGPFLATMKLIEYVDQAFVQGTPELHLAGGNIPDAIALNVKYGLIPDQVWQPEVPFKFWPFPSLYQDLQKAIREQQAALQKIARADGENSLTYRKAFAEAKGDVKNLVLKWSGPLPTQFEWQGKEWTPRKFAKAYGVQQATSIHLFYPESRPLYADERTLRSQIRSSIKPSQARFSILQRSWPEIENQMVKALERGVPVLVGVYWGRSSGHVMTAVGYEKRHGKVFAWKFLNSWGRYTSNGESYFKASDVRKKADQVWVIE